MVEYEDGAAPGLLGTAIVLGPLIRYEKLALYRSGHGLTVIETSVRGLLREFAATQPPSVQLAILP